MVAPITLSRPTRVFARLTFTGEDKSAPAVCCDLSRVASIVPANPLPKNLVANTASQATAFERKMVSSNSTMAALLVKGNHSLVATAAARAESDSAGSESGAVVSVAGVGQSNVSERSNNSASLNAQSEKRASTDTNSGAAKRRKINVPVTPSVTVRKQERSSLLAENEKLKSQNELLKKQLINFQMVFQREQNYQMAVQKVKALQKCVLPPAP